VARGGRERRHAPARGESPRRRRASSGRARGAPAHPSPPRAGRRRAPARRPREQPALAVGGGASSGYRRTPARSGPPVVEQRQAKEVLRTGKARRSAAERHGSPGRAGASRRDGHHRWEEARAAQGSRPRFGARHWNPKSLDRSRSPLRVRPSRRRDRQGHSPDDSRSLLRACRSLTEHSLHRSRTPARARRDLWRNPAVRSRPAIPARRSAPEHSLDPAQSPPHASGPRNLNLRGNSGDRSQPPCRLRRAWSRNPERSSSNLSQSPPRALGARNVSPRERSQDPSSSPRRAR